jgi:cell fate regulator YaaT (PSP1 superfamily)
MKICGVKFKEQGKVYYFKNQNLDLKNDDKVVVYTEKGEQLAVVVNTDVEDTKKVDVNKMKDIIRLSTKKDYDNYMKNLKDAKEALEYARKKAEQNNLDMRFVDADFTLDRAQLMINFVADERVDFRNLVKEIASKYKTRIELHQMGVRDKAHNVGGLGLCGRELCCSKFLNGIDGISINMAKNQDLALNPTKINGLCGRLLCCLQFEDDVYSCHRKILPKVGEKIKTPAGEGKVTKLSVLAKKYTVDINGTEKEFDLDEKVK